MTTPKQAERLSDRATSNRDIEKWCKEQGATESVTYDEETGAPMRTFTIDLKQSNK